MTTQTIISTKYEYNGRTFYELDGKLYLFDCLGIHYLAPAAPQVNGMFYSNEKYIELDPEGLIYKFRAEVLSFSHEKLMENINITRDRLDEVECDDDDDDETTEKAFPRKEQKEDEFEVIDKDLFKPVAEKAEDKPFDKLVKFMSGTKEALQLQAK